MWPSLALAAMTLGAGPGVAAPARFLALGDSYTIGEGIAAGQRWPELLAAALRRDGIAIADPEIIARTGWSSDELAAAIAARPLHGPYGLVSLMIGVNDQYRGRELGAYRLEFARLLDRAIALAGARPRRVVVVSIPDWGVTAFGRASGRDVAAIAREIDLYNAANAEIAAAHGAHYADIAAAARAGGARPDMLAGDGLHPSAAMHARWLRTIAPVARQALAGS